MDLSSIELCAGVGMLGEGFAAALRHLGIGHRTLCYVEREAPAAAQLAALMEAGALHPAPIWSDLLTFDGDRWRGKVDCIVAGFPCQDLSIAGRRAGLDGKRSGLFFDILDLADHCGAWLLSLENVSAIATATASVVDEEEGELDERAAARVVGELADRGWDAEWLTLSASDVGASHGRARWFCLAWRREAEYLAGSAAVAHAGLQHQQLQQWADGAEPARAGGRLANAIPAGRRSAQGADATGQPRVGEQGSARSGECSRDAVGRPEFVGGAVALAPSHGRNEGRAESGREQGRPDAAERGCAVADTSRTGLQGREQRRARSGHGGGQEAHGPASELRGALPLFAPGPADPAWAGILACRPDLAPATEPGIRMLADGMALLVDESRSHQLRQVGNGVVPLQAGLAFVVLARRAGLFD